GRDESLLLLNEDSGPLLTELCFVFASFKLFPKDNVSALLDRFLKVSDLSGHLPKAYLSGEDLINLGVSPSAQMGDLLKQSYMAQIKGEITSKDQALSWVKGRL
ncbi:MAG: hypothetical protein KDD38_11455, partial [Bdellovibrionales bacterium]|nr:hypothetical protein [Bdellovibrionales bacterium]